MLLKMSTIQIYLDKSGKFCKFPDHPEIKKPKAHASLFLFVLVTLALLLAFCQYMVPADWRQEFFG